MYTALHQNHLDRHSGFRSDRREAYWSVQADVCVVGAGIAGLSVALCLLEMDGICNRADDSAEPRSAPYCYAIKPVALDPLDRPDTPGRYRGGDLLCEFCGAIICTLMSR